MKRIYKYPIQIQDDLVITAPAVFDPLTVQTQDTAGGEPQIWALVDPDTPTRKHLFKLFGTGHDASALEGKTFYKYVGSFQLRNGVFVFHLFYMGRG